MNSTELQQQIQSIEASLKRAENIAFPKKVLATYSAFILLIPIFESALPASWFAHFIFYGLSLGSLRWILSKFFRAWDDQVSHPIIAQSLVSLQKFVLASGVLTSFAIWELGHSDMVFPLLLIHVSFLFFSFGKYTSSILKYASFAQLLMSAAFLILLKNHSYETLLPYFTTGLSLSFFAGVFAREP